MRIGQGYDAHKIIPGSGMTLGGVVIECNYSIEAYSDGDIIIHSLIDALLGAAAYGDLGAFFPSDDKLIEGISSTSMLSTVLEKMKEDQYKIINIDLTYVGQVPKLISYREEIRSSLSRLLGVDIGDISCKATTTDGLGFEGNTEGISCHCVVLIDR